MRERLLGDVRYDVASIGLFFIEVVLFILVSVLLDPVLASLLSNLPFALERWILFFLLVLPAVAGITLAVISFKQPGESRILALVGLLLNSIFALFHVFVLAIAG